ncbi:hypothetical protein HI914_02311 [Erysiphe necator]|nr:hypothetical protein HI914_02311 [Erysiphe necator]
MRHLTGSSYNLLKDKYDERARLNPLHGRTLMNALVELDWGFRARNVLDLLVIFFTKFQTQINKLNYNDEDKMDELKSRLNTRFASRIILGCKETYDEIVDHCYTLDFELGMYEPHLDHTTLELGKSSKPLSEMNLKELKDYRNSLPRSSVIKQLLQNEKRCHRCMQKGHTGWDQDCQFNRLPQTEKFKQKSFLNSISTSDEGNGFT